MRAYTSALPGARRGVGRRSAARGRLRERRGSSSDTTAAAPRNHRGGRRRDDRGGRRRHHGGGRRRPHALVDEATKEGKVNLIALPDTWANYKGILQSFRDKYPGIENPVRHAGRLLGRGARRPSRRSPARPTCPTRSTSARPFAIQAIDEGFFEPYKASTWDEIPDELKDPDGNWVGAYYGIMAIGTNTDAGEEPAEDLRRPEEAGVQGSGRPQRRSP